MQDVSIYYVYVPKAILSVLRLFGLFCGHLVYFVSIWYIFGHLVYFFRFGMLYPGQSGNAGQVFLWPTF
jgi:hypothetical protein